MPLDYESLQRALDKGFGTLSGVLSRLEGLGGESSMMQALEDAAARANSNMLELCESFDKANDLIKAVGAYYVVEGSLRATLSSDAEEVALPMTRLVYCLAPVVAMACLASNGKYRLAMVRVEEKPADG